MFIQIVTRDWKHASYVPIADIKAINREEDDWYAEMKSGATHRIMEADARAVIKETPPIVPAVDLVNACALLVLEPDHTVLVRATRVVGWRVVADDDALPIFADTSTDDMERLMLVQMPDGRWHSTDNMEFFDTLDEAKEEFRARARLKAMADEA